MPRDLDGLADIVVLTVKTAMAPAFERIALLERDNADLRQQLGVVCDLRDRVVTVETKAAIPLPLAVESLPPVDLSPVLERLAVLESHVARLGSTEQTLGELRDRVITVETKRAELAPVPDGLSVADVELAIRNRIDPVSAGLSEVRERLIAVEVRQPVPGPPGATGKDGENGKDGADGLGFDDVSEELEDEGRVVVKRYRSGERVKEFRHKTNDMLYRGVYIDGKSYTHGDVTTWAGSTWYAKRDTTEKPGDGSKDWILIVKRGRDGKDGRDAMDPVPVVRAGVR